MYHLTPSYPEYKNYKKCCQRGYHGSAQRCIYTIVNNAGIGLSSFYFDVLSDSIKDYNGVIQ